jgi:hypothetical protein
LWNRGAELRTATNATWEVPWQRFVGGHESKKTT